MGKGGRSTAAVAEEENVWRSPYNPLDPKAPELPTKGQIKAVIPEHCFHRSYVWSMMYVFRDTVMSAALVYATSQLLSTDIPSLSDPIKLLAWAAGWSFYAFWQGVILTGHWVLAHEVSSQLVSVLMGCHAKEILLNSHSPSVVISVSILSSAAMELSLLLKLGTTL
jgi:hypothetical protein